jgi:hypothetical protein
LIVAYFLIRSEMPMLGRHYISDDETEFWISAVRRLLPRPNDAVDISLAAAASWGVQSSVFYFASPRIVVLLWPGEQRRSADADIGKTSRVLSETWRADHD